MCPKCKETKTIMEENCRFRIKSCKKCKKYFHRDIMAAENMVNKGLSQIRQKPTMASYLDKFSDSKNDDGPGSSGSQKKHSRERKSECMKDAEDPKTKARNTSQPQGDSDHGSKGKRKSECMKDAEDPKTKARKPSQPQGDSDHGSKGKGKRKAEGVEGVYRNLRSRTNKNQNQDLDLNQGESEDSQVMHC
jgi:hypothetical protein